jgi:hypothetical protein
VGCWLRWMRAGTFVAGCCCRTSLAESVAYALSGSARPHYDWSPGNGPRSIAHCCLQWARFGWNRSTFPVAHGVIQDAPHSD